MSDVRERPLNLISHLLTVYLSVCFSTSIWLLCSPHCFMYLIHNCYIHWSPLLWRCGLSAMDRLRWVFTSHWHLTADRFSFWHCRSTGHSAIFMFHDDLIEWKNFPRYWPFVWGIHRSLVNSPTKASDAELFYLRLNEQLNEQSWDWWFETPSWSLWRHCNVLQ